MGITTVEGLLEKCGSAKGRENVAEKTGINKKDLLQWANHADLFRLKGVGSEFSDLLEAVGVDSCPELAQRKAANLVQAMQKINEEKKITRRIPTESMVEDWISQAKKLPKVVSH